MSLYTSALDIRGMSRVTAVSPTCPLKTWLSKKQWQVFIIQFITTLTIIFKCICKLCFLLFCQFKQIKIIFAQIVINIIIREPVTVIVLIRRHLSNCTEYPNPIPRNGQILCTGHFPTIWQWPGTANQSIVRLIKTFLRSRYTGQGELMCWPCDR